MFSPAINSIGFWDMLITRKGTSRCWSGLTTTRAKLNPCRASIVVPERGSIIPILLLELLANFPYKIISVLGGIIALSSKATTALL